MREVFDQQLAGLETAVQDAGRTILRGLRDAVNLLEDWDDEVAERIADDDRGIKDRYRVVESDVARLFALQGPVAGDLRLLLAVLHIDIHLQRMSRNNLRIARFAERVIAELPDPVLMERFEEMGARAEHAVQTALEALERRDLALALSLGDLDNLIDRDNEWIMDHALALGSDPKRREWGMHTIFIARSLERMGDHAVAIAEQVAYIITGRFEEFTLDRDALGA
jgi:phosphate transport system protein